MDTLMDYVKDYSSIPLNFKMLRVEVPLLLQTELLSALLSYFSCEQNLSQLVCYTFKASFCYEQNIQLWLTN